MSEAADHSWPAIVSGGASGIGNAIARSFAESGAPVAIVDVIGADAAADEINQRGGRAIGLACDVTKPADVDAALASASQAYGAARTLVNAAGVSPTRRTNVVDITQDEWERTMAVNAGGMFTLSRGFVAAVRAAGVRPSRIVNILSTASFAGYGGMVAYCASKGAALLLTETMAIDLAQFGVRVNGVAPGSIETPMSGRFRQATPQAERDAINAHNLSRTPLGRVGSTADVVAAVAFLASEAASWITGTVLTVDGGYTATGGPLFDGDGRPMNAALPEQSTERP